MALTNKLTAIADAIREKTNTTDAMTLDEMATAISGITGGGGGECTQEHLPDDKLIITGNCSYKFYGNTWNWFIEDYIDKIVTSEIGNARYMFLENTLEEIPMTINLSASLSAEVANMFNKSRCQTLPYVTGRIGTCNSFFEDAQCLVYIPEDWADKIDWDYIHSNYANISSMFKQCSSLLRIPTSLMSNLYTSSASYTNTLYYHGFRKCYVLEDIVNIPVHLVNSSMQSGMSSNMFAYTFEYCQRVNKITFATEENGLPTIAKWKSQIIDLTTYVGYGLGNITVNSQYHGLTSSTQINDSESYANLKNNRDSWTTNISYSRYNHDSAVETINSLPDTSAYLATAGGTNTIKFKGAAGSSTDGGAINTLTEEEIAVAAAKGWTVTLV